MPGGETRAALELAYPGVGVLERGERVSAVFGRPMTRGATAREAMEDWMDLYQPVFGVDELEWVESRGAEISGGRVAFALRQEVTVEGGILTGPTALPVEGGRLRALVTPDGEDCAVTYVAARVVDTDGGVAAPQITGAEAIAAAGRDERTQHLKVWGEPELVVVEMDLGVGPEVFAAWRLAGQESESASISTQIVHVDAVTGAVVRVQSGVMRAADQVAGAVEGKVTGGLGPPLTSTVTAKPLPDLIVSIVGESSTTTDTDGSYEMETSSSSVDVEFSLEANHWTVVDDVSSGTPGHVEPGVSPPASDVDYTFNATPASQETTAPVNAFLSIQECNAFFALRVTSWQSILNNILPPLEASVNEDCCPGTLCCGARFLEPDSLSFCRSEPNLGPPGRPCNNTAYSTIIAHEYGHYIHAHVIDESPVDARAFSEGYGDSLAELLYNTGTIGVDLFLSGDPDLRTPGAADVTYPACATVPVGEGPDHHYNGQLLGRIWRDITVEGTSTDPLATARLLFTDWTMLSAGSADPHASCSGWRQPADVETLIEVLTVDDVDDDLSNGTPNGAVICQAFADRGIESPPGLGLCPLPLHGGSACRADVNYDGVLDFFDFLEFERMFTFGDLFCDFNADGVLDVFDFLQFQAEFAAGCS